MTDELLQKVPDTYQDILAATKEKGFIMPSDKWTGSLLRTLATSKPGGTFLEMGTGSGLASSWILEGMDGKASLTSFDHDETLLDIAREYLGKDRRLKIVQMDGGKWVNSNKGQKFDFIFADTWHGKYLLLEETLSMLQKGGIYIIDDMLPQPNWPEGHAKKAEELVKYLENRTDLWLSKLHWSSGIIIATKR
ncbi:O-methyltransferase [Cyclobacterium plantarum]|uniref:O-methyltransferase n=1 Tax=Cyclobacterium plantarum TaxID=2716263 RepID=UPI003F7018FF